MSSADDEIEAETDDNAEAAPPPPPPVTREQFLEWRSPRAGAANPERLTNPVWDWLVRSRLSAWSADHEFADPSARAGSPGWCCERFGQSTTELPDGRTILVAGEHEDSYDPDFYIYSDVIVRYPDDRIEIFGYPREVFPPTDFHSATLVEKEGRIILIGNLGHPEQRRLGFTPVFALDLESLAITEISTTGAMPGWIHRHAAVLSDDGRAIVVSRGQLHRGARESLIENIDEWRLDLDTWQWHRLTDRRWPRRELQRADDQRNHLWELQQALWYRSVGWSDHLPERLAKLTAQLGAAPDLDLVERLFRPSVAHEALPEEEDEYNVVRIAVGGVTVRFVNTSYSLQMTVEGELPAATIDAIAEELRERLSVLENTAYTLTTLGA